MSLLAWLMGSPMQWFVKYLFTFSDGSTEESLYDVEQEQPQSCKEVHLVMLQYNNIAECRYIYIYIYFFFFSL